jgi:hypothetical protein
MCDPELRAAILEESGYLNGKKQKDKNQEVHYEERKEDSLRNTGEEERKDK